MDGSTTSGVVHPDEAHGGRHLRYRRITYRVVSLVLAALLVLTVLDVRNEVWGVDSSVLETSIGEGGTLRVEYPSLTRPALASPFSIEVTRPGGFPGPIELAVSRPWIEVWDENGLYPSPAQETGDADWVIYEFDPPTGEHFRFFYDARLEPARQSSVDGAVELRQGNTQLGRVEFRTVVRP